jgi:hypothetical protein
VSIEEFIRSKYKERFERIQNVIIQGVPTYEEYRFQLGQLRGLAELMQDLQPLFEDPDKLDDGA